jgi:hypothetical protein
VLETSGRDWIIREAGPVDAISNCLSMENFSRASEGILKKAESKSFSFKKEMENRLFTHFSRGNKRVSLALGLLNDNNSEFWQTVN